MSVEGSAQLPADKDLSLPTEKKSPAASLFGWLCKETKGAPVSGTLKTAHLGIRGSA